ncbi:unnamed protein product [Mytilus edulis]|uniref:BTB domain-containing protein n=1 Tax=Mytilus edulis TaxID=6550 RepID=A0A8S3R885_MYTED|nr:unnamed protein product [Mytilus edulis]
MLNTREPGRKARRTSSDTEVEQTLPIAKRSNKMSSSEQLAHLSNAKGPGQDNPASTRSVNDIYDLLTKVSNNQESLRQSMEQRITNLEVSFKTEISSKMKSLKDEINIEFAKFDNEIQSLKHKIDTLEKGESSTNTQVSQNITHSKLVFKNVPNTDTGDSEDSLKAYINGIITYLELDFNVTTVQCVGSNTNQQNKTVLVNFDNETQRVNVLKKKRKLKDNPMYSHVYVESDKTRHERMQEANIRKIIKTIPSLEIRGGSGGVGFLVSKSILENFTCSVLNDNYEDILWISLKCKNDINFVIHLCVCYLQPERSSRGNIAQEYYDVLLSQIYLYSGCSNLFVCGDFNGRIGNLQDFDDKIDFIPEKSSIDDVRNAFGNYFLDFIKDAKLCVLNGRLEKDSDNYTYVSKTGKSVVDYIAVPYADLNKYSKFKVQLISDILLLYDITPAAKATIPDHSILSCSLSISDYTSNYSENGKDSNVCSKRRKYNVCNVPNDIFANQRCTRAILSVIEQMENCLNVKNEIDKLYGNFVTVLHSEMDNHLPFKDAGGNVTKKRRKQIQKPYWNTELRELLTKVNRSEKDYLKYKGCKRTQDFLRSNFIEKRKQFDKRLRQCERTHQASIRDKIKNLNDSNPKEFWREINKLGPQKHRPDIDSVRMEDGSFSTDQETILKRWKSEYSKLFKLDNTLVNDTFIDNLSELTEQLEREFNSVTDEDYEILEAELFNENISIEETEEAMRLVKLGKAVGVDNLPNEILCNKILTVPLQKLFDMCFSHALDNWSVKWSLQVNCDKTKVMHIRQKSSPCSDRVFKMGNTTIEYTPRYRYLGLTISETLEYNECVNELITASSRALGALSSKYFLVDGFDYETYTKLFTSTVVPIMDYASAWAKITNSMSKHDITETWMKRQAARAEVPEVCLVVEGNSLLVDKKELFAQSPVFERLSKTVFGKREQQIVIKGKRRKDVVNFLRCTMPGVLEPMNSENVHRILPMAFEYQAKNTLKR